MATWYSPARYITTTIMVSNIQLLLNMCINEHCSYTIGVSNSTYALNYGLNYDINHVMNGDQIANIAKPFINEVKHDIKVPLPDTFTNEIITSIKGEFLEEGMKLNLYLNGVSLIFKAGCDMTIYRSTTQSSFCPFIIKSIFKSMKQQELNNELIVKTAELSDKLDAIVKKMNSWTIWSWW